MSIERMKYPEPFSKYNIYILFFWDFPPESIDFWIGAMSILGLS